MNANYDIIFAGGGTAACVTAGRLAAADRSLKILILEDGPETRGRPTLIPPAVAYADILDENSRIVKFHLCRPSEALGGRQPTVSTARCFGGGSSVNFMMYTRGSASDYDDWETVYKNPGWGSKDLIPLLQNAETFYGNGSYHGSNGPIKVSYHESGINVAQDFLNAVAKYDQKRLFAEDVNNFLSGNAYGRWPQYVDPVSGQRSDVAHQYMYNQLDNNRNLTVLCGKRVVRVLFEGKRAVGIEYTDNFDRQKSIVKASRLVILSAGALGTPAILQRSGIGNVNLLKEHGIKQLVDLPGVGEHYMDHCSTIAPYILSDDAETLDPVYTSDEEGLRALLRRWRETGKGMLANNGVNAGIKMRPDLEDVRGIGQEFEATWLRYFDVAPDKPVVIMYPSAGFRAITTDVPFKRFVSMRHYLCYPISLGFVRISSGTDAYAAIDFHPGFLDAPADASVLRWAYKRGREIVRRMEMFRGEYAPAHPKFPEGSLAECRVADGPVGIDVPDIIYSKEDDEAIDRFNKEKVGTTWHSMGTCAMKPREDGGVVSSRLDVYGTQCLKVVDCSIAPANVGANTCNTAIGIGEKAALIIAEELGISGP